MLEFVRLRPDNNMTPEQARKILDRLTGEEIECLRRLLRQGVKAQSDLTETPSVLKSLEVHKLVQRMGSSVSLSHRGKFVARSI